MTLACGLSKKVACSRGIVDSTYVGLCALPEKVHFVAIRERRCFFKRRWFHTIVAPQVILAQCYCCVRGFEFGQSDWVAERIQSLIVSVVFALPEDVHFVVIWVTKCLRNRTWLRAMAARGVVLAQRICCACGFEFGRSGWVCWEVGIVDVIPSGICAWESAFGGFLEHEGVCAKTQMVVRNHVHVHKVVFVEWLLLYA